MISTLPPAAPYDLELRMTLAEQFDNALAGRRTHWSTRYLILEAAFNRAQIGACVSFRIVGEIIVLDGCRQTSSLERADLA